jgi:hypothetical protein
MLTIVMVENVAWIPLSERGTRVAQRGFQMACVSEGTEGLFNSANMFLDGTAHFDNIVDTTCATQQHIQSQDELREGYDLEVRLILNILTFIHGSEFASVCLKQWDTQLKFPQKRRNTGGHKLSFSPK